MRLAALFIVCVALILVSGCFEEIPVPPKDPKLGDSFVNLVGMEFVWIPSGEFNMGSPISEKCRTEDEHEHKVILSKGFWFQTTEVTQAQWEKVLGSNPSYFKGENLPVSQLSWNDCKRFLEKLNANIHTLENQKKHRRGFTEEKEELLQKMVSSQEEFNIRVTEIKEEMNELKSYLKLLRTIGKVSVSKEVFPGTRIGIKDTYYDVTNEFKHITFVLESGRIRVKRYEDIDLEEITGKKAR